MIIDDIKRRNRAAGNHFFDADSMRFFRSRVLSVVALGCQQRAYFVTSESAREGQRRYSVRVCHPDGRIKTVGEFYSYTTRRAAITAMKQAAARDKKGGFAAV